MKSSSNKECSVNPFAGGFQFQSSQPHMKRFIMFDHSGGKGRVFFHPALAQDLFNSAHSQDCESSGFITEKLSTTTVPTTNVETLNSKLSGYKQMVESAFISLQAVRAGRQNDMMCGFRHNSAMIPPGVCASSLKPKVSETQKDPWASGIQASKSIFCEEKMMVSATLSNLRGTTLPDCSCIASRSQYTRMKQSDVSGIVRENSEDLDALLSCDENDDEDVQSTGHSPDESLGKEGTFEYEEEDEEVEQFPKKRRRVVEKCSGEESSKEISAGEEVNDKIHLTHGQVEVQTNRRQKIKETVKALRKMIPGGPLLDAALVLDETIMYVKTLRDHVNRLEASRLQSRPSHL